MDKFKDKVENFLDELGDLQISKYQLGIPFGLEALDQGLYGLERGEFVVIGGLPSSGKSALLLQIALNAASEHFFPVAFISPENTERKVLENILVQRSGLVRDKFQRKNKMEQFDWVCLEDAVNRLVKLPFYIDCSVDLNVVSLRKIVKELVQEHGVRAVFLDCIQLVIASKEYKGVREQEIGEVSRTLKAIAKEFNVAVVATSRLSRNVHNQVTGGDGSPQLSHLRESGSIEHDADVVIFIHRPGFVGLSENPEDGKKVQFIVAKNKNGETFRSDLKWEADRICFSDFDDCLD